jgi:Sec-independent protein secretion pathway component TatC
MRMPVVDVRVVRVRVGDRPVLVGVVVRLARRVVRAVRMLVMRAVAVGVGVFQCPVVVGMLVPLGQVQPESERHQKDAP